MKRSLLVTVCSFLFLFNSLAFAQINVVSPVKGTWCNKQMLVIDATSDGDYFYSVDGSDPASFGFAYDGPVLLDVEGDVTLKITKIISRNKKEYEEVKYTVKSDDGITSPYASFISSFYDSGLINYTSGSELQIPSTLFYSFGLPPDAFIKGRTISLSEKSVVSRSIPCTVWDQSSNKKWRFIVKTYPVSAGAFSRRDLPVQVKDWETVEFLDDNLIYKIDSEYWGLPKKPVILDRSVSHMISWQSLAYEFGNPVEFIILPAKPQINTEQKEDGEINITVTGDESYKLSVLDKDNSYEELFNELGIDVFYGDKISGNLKAGIFCNGLLQGTVEVPYEINKRPPTAPEITGVSENFYSRSNVSLTITGNGLGKLYYSVSEPLAVSTEKKLTPDSSEFAGVKAENYITASGNSVSLELKGLNESGVYYKVSAYTSNGTNISEKAEYSVLIDQYNFYYDASAQSQNADGTADRPYSDFNELIKNLNSSRNTKLNITGEVVIPKGKHQLSSNCVITGTDNSSLVFEPDAQLVVIDSTLEIKGVTIRNNKSEKSVKIVPLIKGERSNLIFTDCLMYGNFEKNGTILEAVKSNVYVDKCIGAVACSSYASFISGVYSKLNIKNSNLNASADTSVLISLNGGNIDCHKNTLKVSGKTGRIAELFTVDGTIEGNVFKGELTKASKSVVPVFTENNCNVKVQANENYGF